MHLGIVNENAHHGDAKKSFTTGVAVGRQLKGWVTGGGEGGRSDCFWRVRYYNDLGTTLLYTEYVVNGGNAVWGVGHDWSHTSGGVPSSTILENISSNIDAYNCAEYVALPYIQSSGNNQWINTAITIKANTKIEADIYVDRYVAGSGSYLCAYGSGYGTGYLGLCVTANSRVGSFDYCGGGNGYMSAVGAYEQQIKVIINHATGLAQWFDSNGDLIAGVQHSTVNPSSGGSIGIFALSDWGRGTAMKGRLYGFKIYEGSTLVFNGRPALDDQNVPCLYDLISMSYFYSYTATPFLAPIE